MKTCLHSINEDMSSFSEDMCRRYVFGEWRRLHQTHQICLCRRHRHIVSSENEDMSSCDDMKTIVAWRHVFILRRHAENEDMSSCTCLHSPRVFGEWYTTFSYRYESYIILHEDMRMSAHLCRRHGEWYTTVVYHSPCAVVYHSHIDMKTAHVFMHMSVRHSRISFSEDTRRIYDILISIWRLHMSSCDDREWRHVFMRRYTTCSYRYEDYRRLSSHECTFYYRRMNVHSHIVAWMYILISSHEDMRMSAHLCRRYVFGEWTCLHVPTICLRRMKMSSCADDMSSFTRYVYTDISCLLKTSSFSEDMSTQTYRVFWRHRRHDKSVSTFSEDTICLCRQHDMSVSTFSEDTICLWHRRHNMSVSTTRYVCVCDIEDTICLWHGRHDMSGTTFSEDTICLWHRQHDMSVSVTSTTRYVCVFILRRHDMFVTSKTRYVCDIEDTIGLCRHIVSSMSTICLHSPKTRYVCVDILRRHDMSVSTICLCRRYVCVDDIHQSIHEWKFILEWRHVFILRRHVFILRTFPEESQISEISNLGNLKSRDIRFTVFILCGCGVDFINPSNIWTALFEKETYKAKPPRLKCSTMPRIWRNNPLEWVLSISRDY